MRSISLIVFLLMTSVVLAQQTIVKAIVKDAVTKEPVVSASIGIRNSAVGTITNEEGVFELSAPQTATIMISCLGYKVAAVPVSEYKGGVLDISLMPSDEELEEITVTKTPLWQILQDVITTSKAKFNKPIVLHTYYREFSKTNGKYDKFSDGMLDYHVSGNTKKTKSDLIIKQNRTVNLKTKEEEEEDGQGGTMLNVQYGISNSYTFEYLKKVVLDDENYEDYNFQLRSKKDKSGNDYFTLYFDPKDEVEKALFKGAITYDANTKLIFDVDIFMAPSHQKYVKTRNYLIARVAQLDARFRASYKMVGNNYVLAFNNRGVKVKFSVKKYTEEIESRSDLIVTNFEKDNQTYSNKEVFTKRHLYQKPSHYTEKFWLKNNAIVLTDAEERIIAALENAAAIPSKPTN